MIASHPRPQRPSIADAAVSATLDCVRTGSSLFVRRDLDHDTTEAFEQACLELCASGAIEVIIDLSRVRFICSSCLGILIFVSSRLRSKSGQQLTLRIHADLVEILDLFSLREIIRTEVIE